MSLLNLQEIDQEEALNLSKFFINSEQNVMFFGRKGTGKTEIALQASRECGYKVNYINLSVLDRSDLSGFPNIHSSGNIIEYKSPYYLPPLDGKADQIILFDEVDKAPSDVTAPLLEILQFRTINGKPINATACILTGNLLNEGAFSNVLNTALLDRSAKFVLKFDFDKWLSWAKNNGINDLVLSFLSSNQKLACGNDDDTSYASPSPRGWTLASKALTKAKEFKVLDVQTISQIVSGFVGNEAGIKFKIWYEFYRKFEPLALSFLRTGLLSFDFNDLKQTEKLSFVVTLCHLTKLQVIEEKKRKIKNKFASLEMMCKFLSDNAVDREMQVIALSNSFDFDFIIKNELFKNNMFFDHYQKINENITFKK